MKKIRTKRDLSIPSERILFALHCLREAEKPDSDIQPNMNYYYYWRNTDHMIHACFGGIAAYRLGLFSMDTDDFDILNLDSCCQTTRHFCRSLDDVRQGFVEGMLRFMDVDVPTDISYTMTIYPYDEDPEAFKKNMLSIVRMLKSYNL